LLLLVLLAWWMWFRQCGGVSHRELKEVVSSASRDISDKVDARCDAIDRRLERIESKLDRLLELAVPKPPDGMRLVD